MATIDPRQISLEYDGFGRLVLVSGGQRIVGVDPVRAFPLSDPHRWLSLVDLHGRELVAIDDLAELAPVVREMILRELSQQEFVPQITQIVDVSSEADPAEWRVQTDRGPTQFVLNSEDDLRHLPDNGLLITDANGVRYQIANTRQLDSSSRKRLRRYL